MHFEIAGREYRVDRLMLPEARAIQRVTGKTISQVLDGVEAGEVDMECLAAILWVIFKREHPTLTWEQMDEPGGPGDVDLLSFKRLNKPDDEDQAEAEAEAARTLGGPQGNGRPGQRRRPPRTPAGR